MKALELLYQYHQADKIAGGYMSKPITEAIEELEELQQSIKYSIEEIEWALAKPEYADVYLNNALRFLKGLICKRHLDCIYAQEAIDMAEDIESGQMEAIDDTLHFEFDEDFTKRTNTSKGVK